MSLMLHAPEDRKNVRPPIKIDFHLVVATLSSLFLVPFPLNSNEKHGTPTPPSPSAYFAEVATKAERGRVRVGGRTKCGNARRGIV